MKILDLVRLILGNLSRRKARVGLTAIGVVIGTAAVVILVSLAIGLQRNANEQLYGIGDLTQIQVMPAFDMMEGGEAWLFRWVAPGAEETPGSLSQRACSRILHSTRFVRFPA
jgi:ABC-type antimicrobial peptide transport system permease subunit